MQTITVDWRSLPSADQVRAHQSRTKYGYGRWLCEATGKIYALDTIDDRITIEDGDGDFDVINNPYLTKERTSLWLPVGKTGLPETWP